MTDSIEFGGPDLAPRRLRDLLEAQVDATPAGASIDWATYYFRDLRLADALIRASDRGVRVRLALEAETRRAGANDEVIARLSRHGLGGGFCLHHKWYWARGKLHAKIYCFSEPDFAWVGSFNPSGNEPEDAETIAEIGDQDRGHNLLLAIRGPKLVRVLRRHVARLCHATPLDRIRPSYNRVAAEGPRRMYFYPRLRTRVVEREIAMLGKGARLTGAVSHLKPDSFSTVIERAARRGVAVRLLVHDTERRVPAALVATLAAAGVEIARYRHPAGLPMHAKFLLLTGPRGRCAWLGSYNHNTRSRKRNHELLLRTADPAECDGLQERFDAMWGEPFTIVESGNGPH
ncbi:MAG: phosphatidylserine/phosphatidylglycerophosphate/cardiolipin synthase family protein [Steroidobacteraceae bacterium]